jgi:hypothetical protein
MPITYAGKSMAELQALQQRALTAQEASQHDKGRFQNQLNAIAAAMRGLNATAPKVAAAAAPAAAATAAAPAAAAVTPLPQLSYTPPPLPAAPAAVTAPEAAIAPTVAAAQDRADVALQQPIQAPGKAQPGQPAIVEDEAAKARRKLAERNFLGRITGVLTGVSGAKPGSTQIGSRTLLGGTA